MKIAYKLFFVILLSVIMILQGCSSNKEYIPNLFKEQDSQLDCINLHLNNVYRQDNSFYFTANILNACNRNVSFYLISAIDKNLNEYKIGHLPPVSYISVIYCYPTKLIAGGSSIQRFNIFIENNTLPIDLTFKDWRILDAEVENCSVLNL